MSETTPRADASEVRVAIGGQAGFGIKASGQILARAFAGAGLHTFDLTEYPSLIRGGHNVYFLRVSTSPIHSHVLGVDVLVALNQETLRIHLDALTDGAAVVFDPTIVDETAIPTGVLAVPVPLEAIAREAGKPIMRNTVANGAVLALLGFPLEHLESSLRQQFAAKSETIAEANVAVARAGYDSVVNSALTVPHVLGPVDDPEDCLLIDGNSAVGLGALAAGLGFYAAYPMTPSSSLLHFMAAQERRCGIVVKHVEDELAAMNMVVGASFAGARAMCGTSGGGFALMTEAFGLAGVSESAVVVMVSQRPGPATGLPTWTEQGDLRTVLHAGQGEFPRVVMAPGDHEDCFELAWQAFNLADKLQTPVVLLLDNYLSENRKSVPPFDVEAVSVDRGDIFVEGTVEDYARYRLTDSGVSQRAIPGVVGALQVVNSYDHDEYGFANEMADMRTAQNAKRARKLELATSLVPGPVVIGPEQAAVQVLCWGSTKMPLLEAASWLSRDGIQVRAMHVRTLWPFPSDEVAAFLDAGVEHSVPTVVIEGNLTGQLESLIRQECLQRPDGHLRKWDGRPFSPEGISRYLREVVRDA